MIPSCFSLFRVHSLREESIQSPSEGMAGVAVTLSERKSAYGRSCWASVTPTHVSPSSIIKRTLSFSWELGHPAGKGGHGTQVWPTRQERGQCVDPISYETILKPTTRTGKEGRNGFYPVQVTTLWDLCFSTLACILINTVYLRCLKPCVFLYLG